MYVFCVRCGAGYDMVYHDGCPSCGYKLLGGD